MRRFMTELAAVLLTLALLALGSALAGKAQAAGLGGSCWKVFWLTTGAEAGDIADEVICFDSDSAAHLRESSIFGDLVPECGKVSVDQGNGLTLTVDYSTCPPDTPTRTIACPAPDNARLKCSWTHNPSGQDETTDAWLVREGS
ncbi:MAG: hypothetical protein ACREFM_06795 [Hypericibacter sp.]